MTPKKITPFSQKIYSLLKQVPKGNVTTYKALAHAAGIRSYRAIGQVLKHNPNAPFIPCHRVVASDGTIGGFMGKRKGKEIDRKVKLLREENIQIVKNTLINFDQVLFDFSAQSSMRP